MRDLGVILYDSAKYRCVAASKTALSGSQSLMRLPRVAPGLRERVAKKDDGALSLFL